MEAIKIKINDSWLLITEVKDEVDYKRISVETTSLLVEKTMEAETYKALCNKLQEDLKRSWEQIHSLESLIKSQGWKKVPKPEITKDEELIPEFRVTEHHYDPLPPTGDQQSVSESKLGKGGCGVGNLKDKKCHTCGKLYTPTSNVQKVCPECKPKQIKKYQQDLAKKKHDKKKGVANKSTPAIREEQAEILPVSKESEKFEIPEQFKKPKEGPLSPF